MHVVVCSAEGGQLRNRSAETVCDLRDSDTKEIVCTVRDVTRHIKKEDCGRAGICKQVRQAHSVLKAFITLRVCIAVYQTFLLFQNRNLRKCEQTVDRRTDGRTDTRQETGCCDTQERHCGT